ncbi:MAG: PEP-CTERM sorting domain-containing protein [Planctomycetota bacterium]
MKRLITTALIVTLSAGAAQSATIFSLDIGGTDDLESGFTALPVDGSVTVAGIEFTQSVGSNGFRSNDPSTLTKDFAQANSGETMTVAFGGAGDLAAGLWQVEIWSYDYNFPADSFNTGIVDDGTSTTLVTGVTPNPTSTLVASTDRLPAVSFEFTSDGTSAYSVFLVDEPGGGTRTRLNAVRLTFVPEPGSLAMLSAGALCMLRRRRN